jgi:hypothetical protein
MNNLGEIHAEFRQWRRYRWRNYQLAKLQRLIDTYGYLYLTTIDASDLSSNLLTFNDDNGGNLQFLFTYTLQAGTTYIVIFTTYSSMSTGPFSLGVYGPSRVSLRRINLSLGISSTTARTPSTSEYDQ